MHLEGNDTIDVQWSITDAFTLGLNAREEPGISSLGATVAADTFATAGNVETDCSAGGSCGQSLMLGPVILKSSVPIGSTKIGPREGCTSVNRRTYM